jgi:competence protein ComEC
LSVPVTIGLWAGFGLLALGWLLPPLGAACGFVCDACLGAVQVLISAATGWPGSHFWVSGPDLWWVAGFYGGIALFAALPGIRPPLRWRVGLLAAWAAAGLAVAWLRGVPCDRLTCTFLDVGHGCCAVVEFPGGETLVYDAGRLGSPASAARSVAGFLWSRGKTHIDAVVISHADLDHYGALPELLARFSVGAVYTSRLMFLEETPSLVALRDAIDAAAVPRKEIWAGDRLALGGGCEIRILHPPRDGVLGSDNANSIVLSIEYAGRRLLLTGDLEPPGLDGFLAEEPLDCDVVLVPHHGSRESNPPGFAAHTTPEWVVISGGHDVDPAVAAAYAASGAGVWHTALDGAVQFVVDVHGIGVVPHR